MNLLFTAPIARPAYEFLSSTVLHILTHKCRKRQPSDAGRHQEIFLDQELQFHLDIQTLKLMLNSHQCSQAVGEVIETITSQAHNTGQDAARQQP